MSRGEAFFEPHNKHIASSVNKTTMSSVSKTESAEMTKEQIEVLKMRLNAQAMEIVRLRQENDDIRDEAHHDDEVESAECPGCHRILIGWNVVVECKPYTNDGGDECSEACSECVDKYDLAGESIKTDFCEACGSSFVNGGYNNHRPVVWFNKSVDLRPQGGSSSHCSSACQACLDKYELHGLELAW